MIDARNINIIFVVGREYIYHLLPEIKEKFPQINSADQLFNEFGHIKNNREYSKHIDSNIVASTAIKDVLIQGHKQQEKIRVVTHGVDVNEEFNPALASKIKSGLIPDSKFIVSFLTVFLKRNVLKVLLKSLRPSKKCRAPIL